MADGSRITGLGAARGRSPVVLLAAAITIVIVIGACAAGWLDLRTRREQAHAIRTAQVDAVVATLGRCAEPLLAGNDLPALQKLVSAAAEQTGLSGCRVILSDGSVVAAANPALIDLHLLPEQWAGDQARGDTTAIPTGDVSGTAAIRVDGRGAARVMATAPTRHPHDRMWRTLAPALTVGSATLLAVWLLIWRLSAPLGTMVLIREALLTAADGETATDALRVDAALGPEADAWNTLIDERDRLNRQAVGERTIESLQAHRTSSADLDSACDAMWQGLIVVDPQLRARYVNGAAAVLLQSKPEVLLGAEINRIISDQRVLAAISAALEGSSLQRKSFDVERRDEDETGMLRISVRPVRRDDPDAAIVVIEDITQLRVAEDARHAFVAHATHELRTPLTNIRLYVESLLEDGDDDAVLRGKAVNVINQESRRLERIVTDMLSVSEIEAGSLQLTHDDVRLEEIFAEIQTDYEAQAREKQMTLTFALAPKLPMVHGDRDKIMLAIHNLVGNALKYTPAGGQVQVTVTGDEREVQVAVADTGIGIGTDDCEHVFERFYRAGDQRVSGVTGSGLGLALAREVIRLHGGDITLTSRLNEGSTFTLTVPARSEAA